MDSVRRSLVGGWHARKAKAGRFTLVVVVLLLTWLIIGWLVGRAAIAP
jgi:hypothetical protein